MTKITTFGEAQNALRQFYGTHATGVYTLDRMQTLMDLLDNPQDKLRVIHIAGTSGKTSTAYFVTSLLAAAGHKVGLTVSPHVDELNERVQLNCVPLEEQKFCAELSMFLDIIRGSGITPSYFECMIAFAFWEFERQQVDYAVIEVGLGGLLDGTNVVTRQDKVCVITDIGLDHTEVLGDTLPEVAAQKAGIIMQNNHVFMYRQADEITETLASHAHAKSALVHMVPDASSTVPASNLPQFQQRNLWLAAYTASYVLKRDANSELTTRQINAACRTYIPARMEIVDLKNKILIIDGAHNAQKLQTLFTGIREKYPDRPIAALVGFVDGDPFRLQQALEVITQSVERVIVTSFYTEKDYPKHSVKPDQVVAQCHELGFDDIEVIAEPPEAFTALLSRTEVVLLVSGSFYLLNHIRPLIRKELS